MKRFTKEIKIGSAFLFCLAMLYIGVNFLKGNNVFSTDSTYYAVVSNTGGIVPSSVITTNGFQVGTVSGVDYDYANPNRIVLTLKIKESLRIPKGSNAVLVNSLLGGVSVDLRLSRGDSYCTEGDTLLSGFSGGLTDQIEHVMLPQITTLVPKVDSLITSLSALAADPSLGVALNNLEDLSRKINQMSDELNGILNNEVPILLADLQGAAHNVYSISGKLDNVDYESLVCRLDSTISNLQMLSVALIDEDNTVGSLLSSSELYDSIRSICTNANALIEDVKAHPSRYINISVFGKK